MGSPVATISGKSETLDWVNVSSSRSSLPESAKIMGDRYK